uniref:NADH-ubiquinone oxidoreductase chain 2 n=1 Tax=Empoascanara hongkongica TaxID=3057153 RepID=A0AA51RIF6_9HEMI|nr:NADH dehydrogenase subunit 2 [Empoascanara hongkongica]WMQ52413.1 NADH dehydrogenase subunit 2 [Empoascanara hongkongica]
MKMNSSKMFFLSFMIVGVMICLCSNNWLFIWAGLELSLVTLLPILQSKLIITSESMMKYFLVQSISSGFLIIGMMTMLSDLTVNNMLMTFAILMKMGVAPFHSWLISVIESIQPLPLLIILTISKVPPLMILSFIQASTSMIVVITMLVGSIMGLNQTAIKKLVTYSSIFNMGLIILAIKNNFIWMIYLIVYSTLLLLLIWVLTSTNSLYVNQLIFSENFLVNKFTLWINLLSMGGMPPLLGFSIKLMVIEFAVSKLMIVNLVMIILLSTIVMFFYLRMVYLTLMFYSMTPKWWMLNSNKFTLIVIMVNFTLTPLILMTKVMN